MAKVRAELEIKLWVTRTWDDEGEVNLEDQATEYGNQLGAAFERMSSEETKIEYNETSVEEVLLLMAQE